MFSTVKLFHKNLTSSLTHHSAVKYSFVFVELDWDALIEIAHFRAPLIKSIDPFPKTMEKYDYLKYISSGNVVSENHTQVLFLRAYCLIPGSLQFLAPAPSGTSGLSGVESLPTQYNFYCNRETHLNFTLPLKSGERQPFVLVNRNLGDVMVSINDIAVDSQSLKTGITAEMFRKAIEPFSPEIIKRNDFVIWSNRNQQKTAVFRVVTFFILLFFLMLLMVRIRLCLLKRRMEIPIIHDAAALDLTLDRLDTVNRSNNASNSRIDKNKYDNTVTKRKLGKNLGPWGESR